MPAAGGDDSGKGWSSRRRLSSVLLHVARRSTSRPLPLTAKGCSVYADGNSHWVRARQRDWRVGDRFKLLDGDKELARLYKRVGIHHDLASGWTGEILNVERGSPVAVVRYDLKRDSGERNSWTTIPLAAAMRLVSESEAPVGSEHTADALLIQHMEERASEDELPVMIMDATLPGQKIALTFYNKRNKDVIRRAMDTPSRSFAMLGVHKPGSLHNLSPRDLGPGGSPFSASGSSPELADIYWNPPDNMQNRVSRRKATAMYTGVEVQIEQLRLVNQGDGLQVELKGLRQFELSEGGYTWKEGKKGCRIARVSWCVDPVTGDDYGYSEREAGAKHIQSTAAQLPGLVEQWVAAVVNGGHERSLDHLTNVLDALGPMPQRNKPGEMAMWVAALVNPHPSLGVEKPIAYDIRPTILKAVTAAHRVSIAVMGIKASIELMAEMAAKPK